MKKYLVFFILVLCFAVNSFASPLIFKATKEITTNEVVEIGTFDASKYKQIRIAIKAVNRIATFPKEAAEINLENAKRILSSTESFVNSGGGTKSELDKAKAFVGEAQSYYDNATPNAIAAGIFGIEETSEILINEFDPKLLNRSFVIDNPPSKISVKVYGKGTYKLYVWGTQ